MDRLATSLLPSWGSPTLQSGGQNQQWPTSGQIGYISLAVLGVPKASKRGTTSALAHKWRDWLHHPCHLGGPQRFKAGDKFSNGPQVGTLATSPMPSGGSPTLQSGGQNQQWPTSAQIGYISLAVLGVPKASKRGTKSALAHKWIDWLHHSCHLGGPQRFKAGDKISTGPQVGTLATSPLPSWGSPTLQSGGRNQQWPTSGQIGYITLPSWGSPTFQSGGQNQHWPTSGHIGYITLAILGVPNTSKRGTKSAMAHKWAHWLHHPCHLGGPQRFKAGDEISNGPQVGRLATSPLPSWGSPTLQSGGQNQQWPTSG